MEQNFEKNKEVVKCVFNTSKFQAERLKRISGLMGLSRTALLNLILDDFLATKEKHYKDLGY